MSQAGHSATEERLRASLERRRAPLHVRIRALHPCDAKVVDSTTRVTDERVPTTPVALGLNRGLVASVTVAALLLIFSLPRSGSVLASALAVALCVAAYRLYWQACELIEDGHDLLLHRMLRHHR